MIVTEKAGEISSTLSEAFGRGITLIEAKGYYSGADQTVIYFVVNRFQIARLKRLIHEQDPHAFVAISEVADVFGSAIRPPGPNGK